MAKKLMLQGFDLVPKVHLVDFDEGEIEAVTLGTQFVKLADLPTFATQQWPMMWDALNTQMEEQVAAAEAQKPNRAARRRTDPPSVPTGRPAKATGATKKAAPRSRKRT